MVKFNNAISKKFDKEESQLLKKLNACRTRKCAKTKKARMKESKIFEKEQDIQCPQKSPMAFYDCSVDFYEKSKYKNLFDKNVNCGKKKCDKERKTLKKFRNQERASYIFSYIFQ